VLERLSENSATSIVASLVWMDGKLIARMTVRADAFYDLPV